MRSPGITLLFLTLAVYACKKDRSVANYQGDYEISGQVMDETSGSPIPYAAVGVLEEGKNQTSSLGTRTTVQGTADKDGRFHLKFYANSTEKDYMLTAKALLFFDKISGDYITFTKNGKKNQDVKLLPYAYLNVHIVGNQGGSEILINGIGGPYYTGADTVEIHVRKPYTPVRHTYWVYFSQDPTKDYKKTIEINSIAPHDTAYYEVEF